METGGNTGKSAALLVSALCIYGTIGWALAYINLPSEVVVLCRGFIGSAFIVAVALVTKRRVDVPAIRREFKWLAAGGISLGLNWVMLFAAYRATTVSVAILCNYMAPIMLVVAAPLILGEKRSPKKGVCALVAAFGMTMVAGVFEGGAEGVTAEGIALGLAAAVFGAALVVFNKKLGDVPVFERSATQLAFAALVALPFVVVNNFGHQLAPDTLTVVLVVLLGVVHTGVAYCLYFSGLAGLSAQTVGVLGYVEPAVSVLVSTLILHEPLSLFGWVGAAIIIASAAIGEVVD